MADYANTKGTHYADPGLQADGKKRYPLDSESECRAAWSYISMPKNAAKYSPEDLAKVKAAIKAAGRKYGIDFADTHTMAAAQVLAGALRGVELARPGTYQLASGPTTFTLEMLQDAARYAARSGARPSPLKIGHTDKRFMGDGEPSLGWLSNLVMAEDDIGPVLLGDVEDMPDWLAAAAPTAWPNRSVEGWTDYTGDDGQTYSFVIDGLALLGVTPPGISSIRSLRDLPAALGVAASARVVASFGDLMTTAPAEETQPPQEESTVDPSKIREALGLPSDASDEAVSAAFNAALPPPTPTPEPVQAALFDAPAPPAPTPLPVAASGTVVLASSVWDETQKTIKSLTTFVEKTKRDERDQVIAKAVQDGKFTPAQRQQFSRLWDADPDGTRTLIEETLTPNSALAVMASGYAGDNEDVDFDREFGHLFPKEASRG